MMGPFNISESSLDYKQKFKEKLLLIVEDDLANAQYFKAVFNRAGATVMLAANGAEALTLIEGGAKPDVILMDLKMPVMNGYIATQEIRKLDNDVPIIAVTAFALDQDDELVFEVGCNGYIAKPVSKEKLLEVVNSYL